MLNFSEQNMTNRENNFLITEGRTRIQAGSLPSEFQFMLFLSNIKITGVKYYHQDEVSLLRFFDVKMLK